MTIYETVSENVRAAIDASELTQSQVAEKLGVDRGNFNTQLHRGKFNLCRLVHVAKILGVSTASLLDGVDKDAPVSKGDNET